jgi:CMP-N-acetylneuraminic acid synthetase
MNVAIVVPAKGKSERVHRKNMRVLNGKTLLEIALEKALAVAPDDVYVSSEAGYVLELGERRGATSIHRPDGLSDHWYDVMEFELVDQGLADYEYVFHLHCTAPLLSLRSVRAMVVNTTRGGYSSSFTAIDIAPFCWVDNIPSYDTYRLPRSQDMKTISLETHGMYGIRPDAFLNAGHRYPKPFYKHVVNQLEGYDIDSEDDYTALRDLMEGAGGHTV